MVTCLWLKTTSEKGPHLSCVVFTVSRPELVKLLALSTVHNWQALLSYRRPFCFGGGLGGFDAGYDCFRPPFRISRS